MLGTADFNHSQHCYWNHLLTNFLSYYISIRIVNFSKFKFPQWSLAKKTLTNIQSTQFYMLISRTLSLSLSLQPTARLFSL